MSEFFLGVDAGGTTCRVRLQSAVGATLSEATSGPATLRLGVQQAADNIMATSQKAFHSAGMSSADWPKIAVCVGVAGSEQPGATDSLQDALVRRGTANVFVTSDAHIACLGAHSGGDGGIVIVGTGSIGYGLIGGQHVRVGGHGFPASDEGSGAYLGLHAVQMTLNAMDGLEGFSTLTTSIFDALEEKGGADAWLSAATATDFAALAPMVLADGGVDAVAILHNAGQAIAKLVKGLNIKGVGRVALMGGLSGAIQEFMPSEVVEGLTVAKSDALDGALYLARRASSA